MTAQTSEPFTTLCSAIHARDDQPDSPKASNARRSRIEVNLDHLFG